MNSGQQIWDINENRECCALIAAGSEEGIVDDDDDSSCSGPEHSVDPFDGCDTDFDAHIDFDVHDDLNALSGLDAHTGFDALIDLNPHVSDPYVDLKCIVDDLLMSPSHEARTSASEEGTSHLTDDGWAETQKADDPINLDEMNAVKAYLVCWAPASEGGSKEESQWIPAARLTQCQWATPQALRWGQCPSRD